MIEDIIDDIKLTIKDDEIPTETIGIDLGKDD